MIDKFWKFFSESYWIDVLIKTHWESLEQIVKFFWETVILPNMSEFWLKFLFQLPKDMLLELIAKNSSRSENIV